MHTSAHLKRGTGGCKSGDFKRVSDVFRPRTPLLDHTLFHCTSRLEIAGRKVRLVRDWRRDETVAQRKTTDHMPSDLVHTHQRTQLALARLRALILDIVPRANRHWVFRRTHRIHQSTADNVDTVRGQGACFIEANHFELPRRIDARGAGAVYGDDDDDDDDDEDEDEDQEEDKEEEEESRMRNIGTPAILC